MTDTNSNFPDPSIDLPNNDENFLMKESSSHTVGAAESYAGFWLRFWAYLIDLIVVWSLDHLLIQPIFKMLNVSSYDYSFISPITIGGAIVFYLYFLLMTKYFGQTLGKMALGLKVVSLKGNRLSWGDVFFREIIGRFIVRTLLFGITYILVGMLPKKQGLHDVFADTAVVKERN